MRQTKVRSVSLGGGRRVAALPGGALDATPERLVHALREGDVAIAGGVRRLADPFDTLGLRRRLDREDQALNDLLWDAGRRFLRHWRGADLDGLRAFDFARDAVDGGLGPHALTPTESAIRHRLAVRRAEEAVGERLLPVLRGIVVEARPAGSLCHLVTDTAHARTAEAIVLERLREALHRLIDHWGTRQGGPPRR